MCNVEKWLKILLKSCVVNNANFKSIFDHFSTLRMKGLNTLFHLYLKKLVNNLVIYPQNIVSFQNFRSVFAVILQVFDLEYHAQASLKGTLIQVWKLPYMVVFI